VKNNKPKEHKQRNLTPKQERFVEEYLVDLNATQAADRAGYSKKTANVIGPENLVKPCIQMAIAEAVAALSKKNGMDADATISEICVVASSDMADYVHVDEGGALTVIPLDRLPKGKSKAIRKIKERRIIKSTAEGDQIMEITLDFELYDKIKGLELLARHHSLLHDKQEINLNATIKVSAEDKFAELLTAMKAKYGVV
jgi:phage terminase small subunit